MVIKAIFFDTSDTLYHNPELEQELENRPILHLAEKFDVSVDEAKVLFKKTKEKLKDRMGHVPKVAVMMELGVSRIEMQEYLARVDIQKFLKADSKLNGIIGNMHDRYKLGIVTNILQRFLDDVLTRLDIDKSHFDFFVTVDNTTKSKPDKEPFLKALELSKLQPHECVYVGDSLTKDIIPAKNVGMKTIWISEKDKEDEHVDLKIASIYDIEDSVDKL